LNHLIEEGSRVIVAAHGLLKLCSPVPCRTHLRCHVLGGPRVGRREIFFAERVRVAHVGVTHRDHEIESI